MTVKVMLAPSVPQREPKASEGAPRAKAQGRKSRRRRALVFDAEGNEVFITLVCLKCQQIRPLSQFGLRKMADGAIRNQPWCRSCRVSASAEGTKQRKRPAARTAVESVDGEGAGSGAPKIVDAGILAAQVVAALHGGRR
jgi:hypothetical protein